MFGTNYILGKGSIPFFPTQYTLHFRIDYILTSADLAANFVEAHFHPRVWSDHVGLESYFWPQNTKKTCPRWRLNINSLRLELMRTELDQEIKFYFEHNSNALKAVFGGKAIAISSHYKKEKQAYKLELLHTMSNWGETHKQTYSAKIYKNFCWNVRNWRQNFSDMAKYSVYETKILALQTQITATFILESETVEVSESYPCHP